MAKTPEAFPVGEGDLFRLLVQSVTDYAIFFLSPDGFVTTWNEGAERLKGYTLEEVKGKHFSLFYTEKDLAARKPEMELKVAAETGKYEEEGWRIRKNGSRFWAHVVITPIYDDAKQLIGFAKVTRDLSEKRSAIEREKLVHAIALHAASVETLDDLLQMVLVRVGTYLNWPIGHAYVWHATENNFQSAGQWYFQEDPAPYAEFVESSENTRFPSGVGLPGIVGESQKVMIVRDFANDLKFLRLAPLTAVGLQTGVGIPLVENGKTLAVLEFFSDVEAQDVADIVEIAEVISVQVSQFMIRQRAIEDQEAFFNLSNDLLCWAGFDGYFKRVNPTWTKVLGFSQEEMLEHPWLYFVHPDDIEPTTDAGDSQVNEAKTVILENRYRCKDGSYRWLQWHSVPMPGREMIYAIARDVTEQKETARKLNDTLALQNAILNGTSYGIISVGLNGLVQAFNAGAEKLFGYKAEEFVGQENPPRLTDPESLEQRAVDLTAALGRPAVADVHAFTELANRGIDQEFEWNYVRKDGTKFPAMLSVAALRDESGELTGYMGVIQDLTERRRAEEESKRLLTIIDQCPDLIGYGDETGRVIYQNAGGNRMLGYPDDHDQSTMSVRDYHPDWVFKLVQDEIIPSIQATGAWMGETALLHRDGTEIPASQVVFLLPSKKGEPRYIATIARNMTEYKKAEAKMAQQALDLRHSNQELEQFAYVASHDLQEPLRMVCSFLGLLEIEFNDQLNDEAREYIRYAVDGGMRMRALIDGLLDFSRVGRQSIVLLPVDMEAVLREATTNLQVAIAESKAEITHDPLPTVQGDKVSLSRLLQNLISNSLKFRNEDIAPKIHIGVEKVDGEYQLSVRDNGIGIDPKHEEKIFMIFQRLHPKTKYPGSGIGLSICRKIVERHGGRLWLDTEVSEGAQFNFTLKG